MFLNLLQKVFTLLIVKSFPKFSSLNFHGGGRKIGRGAYNFYEMATISSIPNLIARKCFKVTIKTGGKLLDKKL